MPEASVMASGIVERIGIDGGQITYKAGMREFTEKAHFEDHTAGLYKISSLLMDLK